MSASDLVKTFNNLENSWSSLDSWLNFWTALVVLGVVIELVIIFSEYREELHDFRRGILLPPPKPSMIVLVLGLLGAGMVSVGVAGEFWTHIQAGRIETRMRDDTRQLVTLAQGDAVKANARAATADENAGKAIAHASELDKQTAQLKLDATKFEAESLRLKSELADVEVCTAPRVLPYDFFGGANGKLGTGVDPLRPFASPAIVEYLVDNEARRAAENIIKSITAAGWNILSVRPVAYGVADGVSVEPYFGPPNAAMEDRRLADSAANGLIDFLHSFFWEAKHGYPEDVNGKVIRDDNVLPPKTVLVRVGLYPASIPINAPGAKLIKSARVAARAAQEEEQKQSDKLAEAAFAKFPPDVRPRLEAIGTQMRVDAAKATSRYESLCQPLN